MSYTPGPWRCVYDITRDCLRVGAPNVGIHIADVHSEDDAPLIATAPELLAALKTLVENLREWDTTQQVENLWGGELSKLIAKAEGRSE